ncbi:hypothetical protein WJX72_008453 [[Myrmecia] bisecta]|uniref:Transmembrane protein 135 N-terminal domain-containing protein n=1 Tax=[Myrmecia] bisecta TaxID=41462 RepID=A0AAW1P8R1_9CHLO
MSSGVTPSAAPLASALPPAAPAAQREDVYSLRSQLEATRAQLQAALQDMHLMRTNVASGQPLPSPFKEAREAAMPLWKPALDGFKRGFVLAYGVRAGIGIVARALQLWRARQYSALGGWGLLSEKGLVYREDAVRLGLFVGGFTGLYHLLHEVLAARCGTPQNEGQICFIAGTVAGLTLLFQTGGRRRTLAMYMAARLAQCWYNSLKTQGRWHFWGSNWDYGDALLFALSSAQVMYAYVMRPETLPESYWRFIVRSGPIDAKVLEAVRSTNRGQPVNVEAVNAYVSAAGGATFLTSAFPRQIPAAILHPWTTSALRNFGKVTFDTFRKTFPLYMSLTLVPYVVLNLKRAAKAPVTTAVHAVLGALRSTSFLASFVGLYQGTISVHRALFPGDHKLLYYLAGLVASSAVLIEKRARRSELALYTLPRAVDSAFMTLMKRRWVPPMRFGEVGLFALCMGGLMYYREHEPHTMAPFLNTIISRIVFGQTKRDRPRMPRPSSIYFSQSDLPGGFGLADSPREPGENPNPNGGGAGGGNAAGPALDRSSPRLRWGAIPGFAWLSRTSQKHKVPTANLDTPETFLGQPNPAAVHNESHGYAKEAWEQHYAAMMYKRFWDEVLSAELGPMPGTGGLPEYVHKDAAQFVVTQDRVISHPKAFYERCIHWILTTDMDCWHQGMVLEYTWAAIFHDRDYAGPLDGITHAKVAKCELYQCAKGETELPREPFAAASGDQLYRCKS